MPSRDRSPFKIPTRLFLYRDEELLGVLKD
jgi:hypothetical protein